MTVLNLLATCDQPNCTAQLDLEPNEPVTAQLMLSGWWWDTDAEAGRVICPHCIAKRDGQTELGL